MFYLLGWGGQYVDDLSDWWKDDGHTLNLFSAALNENIAERERARMYRRDREGEQIRVSQLKKLAPISFTMMNKKYHECTSSDAPGRSISRF